MGKEPLVTVLTSTYNHARFIGNCVRSVLAQTYQDWEQVIIDDGSTDCTEKIVRGFKDERIVYIRQNHVGIHRLSETYNRGLKQARGALIAILEGDDMFPRRKLELQVNSLSDGAILSFGKVQTVNQDGKVLGVTPTNCKRFLKMTDWLTPLIVHDYVTAGTTMIKREALMKVGGFIQPPNTGAVDYSTFLELALNGKFRFVDEVLGIWVKHGGNQSDSNLYCNVINDYSIPFCKAHGIPVPWKALSRQRGKDLFHVGRHQLLNGERRKALKTFGRAFKLGSTFDKVKALGGMVVSVSGVDLEQVAGKLGRPMER